MKKSILLASALIAASAAMAQNEQLYLFRNDKNFSFHPLNEVESITYSGTPGAYTKMSVTTADGVNSYDLSTIDSCVVRTTALPDIHVQLHDPYAELTDLIKANGKSFIYEATLRMDDNGMFDDLPSQTVEFRGRGNSTWNFAKTPYRFKMSKKTSVCGMAKAKSFALIANYIDPSLMRNAVALFVAQKLGLPFTNHCVPVNVYFNGLYKGAYMLTEKIGVGGGSVDIPEETGMLFEIDSNYDEDFRFKYTFSNNSKKQLPVMVKDPDLTEIKTDATERESYFAQWKSDFTTMANAVVTGKNVSDYVDLRDAARYIIVNSIACNRELQHPKSFYLHKEELGTGCLYHFGPVWDFDWAYGYDGTVNYSYDRVLFEKDGDYAGTSFMKALAQNTEFRTIYKEEWDNFYKEIYPALVEYMDQYALLIEPTARRDGLQWPDAYAASYAYAESAFDTAKHSTELRTWVKNRIEWCNKHANWGLY